MVDLKKMTASEIISRKESYIERLKNLEKNIDRYLSYGETELQDVIREEYKSLKNEIREEAQYLDKSCNSIADVSNEHNAYAWGIMEANAFGFSVRTNSRISLDMFRSVGEAIYKINKYFE